MSHIELVSLIRGFDAARAPIVANAEYALALRFWMRAAGAWREYGIYSPTELLLALEHAEQAAQCATPCTSSRRRRCCARWMTSSAC